MATSAFLFQLTYSGQKISELVSFEWIGSECHIVDIKIVHRLSRVFIIFPSFCDDAFSHSRGARHGDVPLLSAEKDLCLFRVREIPRKIICPRTTS
jgi:hypothetical protein